MGMSPPSGGGDEEGEWGTTTYVGGLTWSFAIISILSGIGWILVLLFCPLDSEEVYMASDGVLYLPLSLIHI